MSKKLHPLDPANNVYWAKQPPKTKAENVADWEAMMKQAEWAKSPYDLPKQFSPEHIEALQKEIVAKEEKLKQELLAQKEAKLELLHYKGKPVQLDPAGPSGALLGLGQQWGLVDKKPSTQELAPTDILTVEIGDDHILAKLLCGEVIQVDAMMEHGTIILTYMDGHSVAIEVKKGGLGIAPAGPQKDT